MYVIMRCDYSSILVESGRVMRWTTKEKASNACVIYSGHVVKWKVAKKILTINRMIRRYHETHNNFCSFLCRGYGSY